MTTCDDDFEPKLGRIRTGDGILRSGYLRDVKQGVTSAGGRRRESAGSRRVFEGNRIGRGAGVGRVLASRDHYAAFRARRVVIKTLLIKLAGQGLKGARAHLRHLHRDGVTPVVVQPCRTHRSIGGRAESATWLDHELVADTPVITRDARVRPPATRDARPTPATADRARSGAGGVGSYPPIFLACCVAAKWPASARSSPTSSAFHMSRRNLANGSPAFSAGPSIWPAAGLP